METKMKRIWKEIGLQLLMIAVCCAVVIPITFAVFNWVHPQQKAPYTIAHGRYGLDSAITTDLLTREETEWVFDDIFQNNDWQWLLSYSVDINRDSHFYIREGHWIVAQAGLTYELIADNTLQLHFPRYEASDNHIYDVIIILGKHKVYG